jgi:hypothetical protein
MGYQSRAKPRGASSRGYQRSPYGKDKKKATVQRRGGKAKTEPLRHTSTVDEVTEGTLRRLHSLGSQRFGSSPFSDHFDRWLTTLNDVLAEFESNPNITLDDQFIRERDQALGNIKAALEEKRLHEASLDQTSKTLLVNKARLSQIKEDYTTKVKELKAQKRNEFRRIYADINRFRAEQVEAGRLKTGFFRGVSNKEREIREMQAAEKLNNAQTELELALLDFKKEREQLQDEFENKRQPLAAQIKKDQKQIERGEADESLEDRWFACEALLDAVNGLLQRKALQSHPP